MRLKRYWLFTWYDYEAYGGTGDLRGKFDFDTPDEAKAHYQGEIEREEHSRPNAEIVDTQFGSMYFWDVNEWKLSDGYKPDDTL